MPEEVAPRLDGLDNGKVEEALEMRFVACVGCTAMEGAEVNPTDLVPRSTEPLVGETDTTKSSMPSLRSSSSSAMQSTASQSMATSLGVRFKESKMVVEAPC